MHHMAREVALDIVENSVVCNRGKKAEPGPSLSGIVNRIKIPKLL